MLTETRFENLLLMERQFLAREFLHERVKCMQVIVISVVQAMLNGRVEVCVTEDGDAAVFSVQTERVLAYLSCIPEARYISG